MRCRKAMSLIENLIDGEISIREEKLVREHIENCPRCRTALATGEKLARSLRKLSAEETPEHELWYGIHRRINAPRTNLRQHRQSRIAFAMGAATMLIGVLVGVLILQPWISGGKPGYSTRVQAAAINKIEEDYQRLKPLILDAYERYGRDLPAHTIERINMQLALLDSGESAIADLTRNASPGTEHLDALYTFYKARFEVLQSLGEVLWNTRSDL